MQTWHKIIIFGCAYNNMGTILSRRLHLIFIILTCSQRLTDGASLGDVCTSDSDCSSLVNSDCSRMFECTSGTCACRSGFGNRNGDGCDKILSGFDEPCGSSYYCNGANQECDTATGRCACTFWYDYHYTAAECILRTYKVRTESCGGWYNWVCLQTFLDSGGECESTYSTCSCQFGYTPSSYSTCRSPQWGEACQWSPSCVVSFDTSTISDDTSSNVPTCTNNICTCPPSHEHRYVNGYNLCLDTVEDDFERYSNGQNCTHFKECQSFLCVKCPGAESGVCMADSSVDSLHHMSATRRVVGLLFYGLVVFLVM